MSETENEEYLRKIREFVRKWDASEAWVDDGNDVQGVPDEEDEDEDE